MLLLGLALWTSRQTVRWFTMDTPSPVPAARMPTLGLKPPEATKQPEGKTALDGVSVLVLGFDRDLSYLGSRRSVTPFMQPDGQPAQEDPTSRGHGCRGASWHGSRPMQPLMHWRLHRGISWPGCRGAHPGLALPGQTP